MGRAHADGDAVRGRPPSDLVTAAAPQGLVIRELSRTEVGPWAEIMIEANGMPGSFADAWRAMEGGLADAPHDHRFLAEIDGMPVAAAAIHTHHGVGYLRAAPSSTFRGRGIQRALIAARSPTQRDWAAISWARSPISGALSRSLGAGNMRVVAIRRLPRRPRGLTPLVAPPGAPRARSARPPA